jgi:hypothetical protein
VTAETTNSVRRPVPPAVRSRQELAARGIPFRQGSEPAASLPILQGGTTYNMAQEAVWLDSVNFAVGRWDGSMSIFSFETAPSQGPLITKAVNDPQSEGVQMITLLETSLLVSSNDDASLALWSSANGTWNDLQLAGVAPYEGPLGAATSGLRTEVGDQGVLVVGHQGGYVSVWALESGDLTLLSVIDVRNPKPVNPWGLHSIYGLAMADASHLVTGSDDGFVSIVELPSYDILSQTVYNPHAQRGINTIAVQQYRLLVGNCAVGSGDANLWYFAIDTSSWTIKLLDRANLLADPRLSQSFNFDTVWASAAGVRCWFASTEEGCLWMGTADNSLQVIGYQPISPSLGSALAYASAGGKLAVVAHDLFQFTTGT